MSDMETHSTLFLGSFDGNGYTSMAIGGIVGCNNNSITNCTADVTIDGNAGTEHVGTTIQMYESADQ